MTHQPIWGGNGRLYWVRCCGWQSGAHRCVADVQRSYAAHLARLLGGAA
jgi:hypothetical protein